jgi:hypothetical protein
MGEVFQQALKGGPPRHRHLLPVAHLSRWDDGSVPSRTAGRPGTLQNLIGYPMADPSNIVIPAQAGIQLSGQLNATLKGRTLESNNPTRGVGHPRISASQSAMELGRVGREHKTDRFPKRPGGEMLTSPGHSVVIARPISLQSDRSRPLRFRRPHGWHQARYRVRSSVALAGRVGRLAESESE